MKTLAIVIGNDEYFTGTKLNYAVKDANDIAAVFERLGFDLIHKDNIKYDQCAGLLDEIEQKIGEYDATIFFFAGHGFQFEGENYLTCVDCQIPPATKHYCRYHSIELSDLLRVYSKHQNKINIIIIDACRRSFGRGDNITYAPVQAPQGTLVAFSTSPNEGAQDGGYKGNSVYTGALLTYIGRERLSVEELFKKVRKLVHTTTEGGQTPWEHTSLIGDFYFNTGQLVHSMEVPYSEEVVKDAKFQGKPDEFTALIAEIRSYNWDRQNPAIAKLLSIPANRFDKNQQFIIGRNLLQTADYANQSTRFFTNLGHKLVAYMEDNENHVLNGILFEIYFNKHGEFREERFKLQCFDEVMALRALPRYSRSFEFIAQLLEPYRQVRLFWVPTSRNTPIDVNIQVERLKSKDGWGNEVSYDLINAISAFSGELINKIREYGITGCNALALKRAVANYLAAPEVLIELHSKQPIENIKFPHVENDVSWP